MTKLKKLALALVLGTTTVAGVAVAVSQTDNIIAAIAQECDHHGNHYAATEDNPIEYWVCCKCHQKYFTKPVDGTWDEGNENNSKYYNPDNTLKDVVFDVDDNGNVVIKSIGGDDRFNYTFDEETGKVGIDGVDNIYEFRQEGDTGKYDITIPDGVSEVDLQDAFKNKDLGTVVIPASVTDIGTGEECMFYNVGDIDKVVYEGNGKDFLTNGLFEAMTEACWKTYKDHTSRLQPYQPSEIVLDGVSYFTNSKVMGDFFSVTTGKSSAGYVFYYKDAVPAKMTNAKGKSYSIDLCGKDTKELNAAFGRDNHATFINEGNM